MAAISGAQEVIEEAAAVTPAIDQSNHKPLSVPIESLGNDIFPTPKFAKARPDEKGRKLPQLVAHRGLKAKFPENSLLAFDEAIKAGATAVETDLHVTADKVVVLSHNDNLKLFGSKRKILECTWDEIQQLKTLAPPHVPMPRLQDLLMFLQQPENRNIWVLLDIKSGDDAESLMRLTASTIGSIHAQSDRPWNQRLLLGLWTAKYQVLAAKYLPGFPIVHIGFNLSHARRNLQDPHIGSLLVIQSLLGPGGKSFLRESLAKPGPTMAWNLGSRAHAEWCARQGLDGLLTDDPAEILLLWKQIDLGSKKPMIAFTWSTYLDIIFTFFLVNVLFGFWKRMLKLDDRLERELAKKNQ